VHPGAKEINGDKGCSGRFLFGVELLAQQHFESVQRVVLAGGHCVSDNLAVEHMEWEIGIRDWEWGEVRHWGGDLDDAQVFNHDAAADAGECFRGGNTLTGGGGNRVAEVALATQTEACDR
jgi:hypothetical protein